MPIPDDLKYAPEILTDPQYWKDIGSGVKDVLGRGVVAGTFGIPVDLGSMVLRPFTNVSETPVGGSEWIGEKMQKAGLVSSTRRPIGELMASLIDPATMGAGAAKFAVMAGMTKNQFGRIAENGKDARSLAEMLARAGNAQGYKVTHEGSAISPSQYVTFSKPGDDSAEFTRQVRISNHEDKYPELASGLRYSTDPKSENTFEQAVNWLKSQGYPTALSTRYSDIPSYEQYLASQRVASESPNVKLDKLLSAWRNLPKATRGNAPTLEDINSGMTVADLWKRGK